MLPKTGSKISTPCLSGKWNNEMILTILILSSKNNSGVARGGGQGGRPPPLAETLPPLLPPQMKLHFVQRSMESRHFESRSAPPAHPSAPLAAPSFWKVWLRPWKTIQFNLCMDSKFILERLQILQKMDYVEKHIAVFHEWHWMESNRTIFYTVQNYL